jgi:hypothetical protein
MKIEIKSRQSIVNTYLDEYKEGEMPKEIKKLLNSLLKD